MINKARLAHYLAKIPISSLYLGPPRAYVQSIRQLDSSEMKILHKLRPHQLVDHRSPSLPGHPHYSARINAFCAPISLSEHTLFLVPRGRLLGDSYMHPLISNRDRFVLDCAAIELIPESHPAHYALRLPSVHRIKSPTLSLVSYWSNNYWHWIFDCLGKFLFLQKHFHVLSTHCVVAALGIDQLPFKRQSLQALGIDLDRILDIKPASHFIFNDLYVSNLPSAVAFPDSELIDLLRRAFLPLVSSSSWPPMIYVSRDKAASRRVLNNLDLDHVLYRHGFAKIYLEDLTFIEQIQLFSGASVILGQILGQHGAGLTNILFCNPNARVFELIDNPRHNPCFAVLAEKLGLAYSIISPFPDQLLEPVSSIPNPRSVTVDCLALDKFLLHSL
jgi:hypothetical protein